MKITLVQVTAFLFIALTPFASVVLFPIYLIANALLAPATAISVLVLSPQVDTRLEIGRGSFTWILARLWYRTNICLALPAVLLSTYFLVFGWQRGNFRVDERKTETLGEIKGRVDVLLGRDVVKNSDQIMLLSIIVFDPKTTYDYIDSDSGDGPV